MGASFEDIAIVDLDLRKTTWSRVHSSMRTLYLKLSREPDPGWVRYFHEERESRVVVKRHGLWIEEGCIVFDCLLDDVDKHHLPDFRQSVDYANARYREWLDARSEESEQMRLDADAEQQALTALRIRIRGDEVKPLPPPVPSGEDADTRNFNARRDEWRAHFRAALASASLASRNKEPARGND
ncbi:MAG: hypothetical protein P4L92_23565 [Rudaea sp.]|nr:hypothetical protein [Rudaea sp.]